MKKFIRLATVFIVIGMLAPIQSSHALQQSSTVATWLLDSNPYFLGNLNGELYFTDVSAEQLWKTDGAPSGTVLLTNAAPLISYVTGPLQKVFARAEVSNGLIFFSADDGIHGQELWRSDGTPQGTAIVKDINPSGSSTPKNLTDVNGTLFFRTDDGIWKSNGTDAGTSLVFSFPTYQSYFTATSLDGLYVFTMDDGMHGLELWKSDGTPSGTVLLSDINPTGNSSPVLLTVEMGKLYFTAYDGISLKLWVTDGTSTGTLPLLTSGNDAIICNAGTCYFFMNLSQSIDIWETDGTPVGTVEVTSIVDTNVRGMENVGGIIYFTTDNGFWKTDGTAQGTQILKGSLSYPSDLIDINGELFFTSGGQLWKSDGTANGTILVKDFGTSDSIGTLENASGTLFFGMMGPVVRIEPDGITTIHLWQLYKSDGTQAGTTKVTDLARAVINCPTPLCTYSTYIPEQIMVVNGRLYFQALDGTTFASKLWTVDNVYFSDVTPNHWSFPWVERLATSGLTGGCSAESYCPESNVTRAQIAIFLERGMNGSAYSPPTATGTVFGDIISSYWAASWIEKLFADGITSGCGAGNYCPEGPVTRAQMAIFLLRAEHGTSYNPSAATGTKFTDVPSSYWAASWIEQLANEGITGGCGTNTYCPDQPVTRAQMAVFLVRTFGLP